MRIFFSVGEPSGDLHGSNLIRRLQSQVPDVECVGFGGPKMAEAGCDLHFDLTTMAVMFLEALKNLRFFFGLVDQANEYFENNEVDAVVLIDYPGFNWWIAKKAKKHNIPVYYYGVPQMWAWAPWRVRKIRKYVDHVLCKLPFEVKWFADRNCHAIFVGHPYFDQLETQEYDQSFMDRLKDPNERLLTLLPGSRDQEVRSVLPILIKAAKVTLEQTENCRVAISCFNEKHKQLAVEMIQESGLESGAFEVFAGRTPELMKQADVCLACSGSVSLELLHHRKPTIIVFKVKRWLMVAQAILMRTRFITLVNLFAAKDIRKRTWAPYDPDETGAEPTVMPEYLTSGDPSLAVATRAIELLKNEELLNAKIEELDSLAKQYAIPGATNRAADYILKTLLPNSDKQLGRKANLSNEQNEISNQRYVSESPAA